MTVQLTAVNGMPRDEIFIPWAITQRMIQKLREKLDMKAKVTPHTLRHSLASELSRNGVPVPTISALVGHQLWVNPQIQPIRLVHMVGPIVQLLAQILASRRRKVGA